MPLGTKESTLRQDFLRGQTSSGIQTVRLTKDICYFPHSEAVVNSIIESQIACTQERAAEYLRSILNIMNFWVTQTDHKTYSLRAPSGQDGSVGKDSWIQVWQGELDPQYPRGRRAEGTLTGVLLPLHVHRHMYAFSPPKQVNSICLFYLFETGSHIALAGLVFTL